MPLWLISGVLGIRKALASMLSIIAKHPWQAAVIALALFGAWEWRGWNRAQAALSACEAGRKADRASYVAAQQEALKRAVAAKEAQEAHYKVYGHRHHQGRGVDAPLGAGGRRVHQCGPDRLKAGGGQ